MANLIHWNWRHDEVFRFIELYKHEPSLWHPNNKFYKDKNKIKEAWERIEQATRIPIAELKRKKESLMTTFRAHYKRKITSLRCAYEEEYEPVWIFYNAMEGFLKQIYDSGETANQRHNHEISHNSMEHHTPKSPPSPEINDLPRERSSATKRKFPELAQARKQMDQAINILCSISDQVKHDPDEVDLFCQLLAKRLKQFDDMDREVVMHDIDQLVYSKKFENRQTVETSAIQRAAEDYKFATSSPTHIIGDGEDEVNK